MSRAERALITFRGLGRVGGDRGTPHGRLVSVRKSHICGVAFRPRAPACLCTPASLGYRLLAPGAFPNGHSQDVLWKEFRVRSHFPPISAKHAISRWTLALPSEERWAARPTARSHDVEPRPTARNHECTNSRKRPRSFERGLFVLFPDDSLGSSRRA